MVLRGVNRSGTEYTLRAERRVLRRPVHRSVGRAIKSWPNVNTVRVPLNESCWLGINGAAEKSSGAYYKTAIYNYVQRLHKYDLIPILELHWVGPGTQIANRQQPMLDADHAAAFWTDVATTFLDDDGVVLEPYNEPFPDGNKDSDAAWACWRDGCTASQYGASAATRPCGTYAGGGHAVDRRRDPRHRIDAHHPARRRAVLERADTVARAQAERSARPARRGLAPLRVQRLRGA